jgi:flavin reductase (DIM6/NTAB) family NADH-FMN oxidoreductase RutF/rubredoxin
MDTFALFKLSYGLYVTGVKTEKGLGGCIIDAVAQVSEGDPTIVIVSCQKKNYTNESIKKAKEFTLSVLPADVDPFVIGNFGFQSARTADKWPNVPHTIEDGLPWLNDAAAWLRLRVAESKEFPTHTMFLCEVAAAELGGSKAKPLTYGDYQAGMKGAVSAAFTAFKETGKPPEYRRAAPPTADPSPQGGTRWVCTVCGYIYQDAAPFETLGSDWACPLCGAGKDAFKKQT